MGSCWVGSRLGSSFGGHRLWSGSASCWPRACSPHAAPVQPGALPACAGHCGDHSLAGAGVSHAIPAAAGHARLGGISPARSVPGRQRRRCPLGFFILPCAPALPWPPLAARPAKTTHPPLPPSAGGLLGGTLGDWAAQQWPRHGRVAVCQLSVGIGVPLSVLLFKVGCGMAGRRCRAMPWPLRPSLGAGS